MSKRSSLMSRQRGGVVLKVLLGVPAVLLLSTIGWYVYADQRLKYWDGKVQEMCEKEGGVQVLQHVSLTPTEYEAMPKAGGYIGGHAPLELSPSEVPTYAKFSYKVIREESPRIWKTTSVVLRKSDGVTVARWVQINRLGGDPIAIDHPSSFVCPDSEKTYKDLASIFIKKENK